MTARTKKAGATGMLEAVDGNATNWTRLPYPLVNKKIKLILASGTIRAEISPVFGSRTTGKN